MTLSPRALLKSLYQKAVDAALPHHFLKAYLPPPGTGRTIVIGAGKASGAMALAMDQLWPLGASLQGLVLTRYDHTPPEQRLRQVQGLARIEVVEAAHPVPDEAGFQATQRMLSWIDSLHLTEQDQVICLISGGGSALLAAPAPGMTLTDLQVLNQGLLRSGASIDEMNCVRKHLSAVQGGRLAARCAPAEVVSLLISDVPGDDPQVIASGPTLPDPTTCGEALAIIERLGLSLPESAWQGLRSGAFESPKPIDPRLARARWVVCATPQQSLEAAAQEAQRAGLQAHILSDAIEGESRVVGQVHAALARQIQSRGQPFRAPCVVLSGGETTVTVRNPKGRGGRAVEFVLGCALALQGAAEIHLLAADTDGIDGMAGHAGAFGDTTTIERSKQAGLSARQALDTNDAYPFFDALGDTLVTGPTYTNVNDFRAVLILPAH